MNTKELSDEEIYGRIKVSGKMIEQYSEINQELRGELHNRHPHHFFCWICDRLYLPKSAGALHIQYCDNCYGLSFTGSSKTPDKSSEPEAER